MCAFVLSFASAQEYPSSVDTPSVAPRYFIAAGEILGNNAIVNLFDRFTEGQATWANVTLESWWTTLQGPWHFDQDSWEDNELEHPIEGALYFTTARSNGFGFWESAAWTAAGEFMWKLFGEADDPNINDMITTTMGGVALGEMLHRLYVEAKRQGSAARFFISPMDAGNDAVFGEGSWDKGVREPSRVSLSLEAGLVAPYLDLDPARGISPGFGGITGEVGYTLVYGDPFGEQTAPFDWFEQRLNLEFSPSLWGFAFFSSGTLFALPLVDTRRSELSLASCLHFDIIYNSFTELEANAVGLSILDEQDSSNGFHLAGELHLNAVVLGTNENLYLKESEGIQDINNEVRNYDFCFGEGVKIHLGVSRRGLGSLSLDYAVYGMNGYPAAAEAVAPFDYVIIGVLNLSYEHAIAPHLAIGSAYTLYHMNALYDSLPSVDEYAQAVTIYVKLNA
ncbi:MAG: DUF3943 domain-containing protein [Rectinemataceae bacterium]|jgi:hypothetical protein